MSEGSFMVKKDDWCIGNCTKLCDNQSVIHLANHQVYHERMKHIDVRLHFIRDMVESEKVRFMKIMSEDNLVDVFTKSLTSSKFKNCLDLINFS